MCKTYVRLKGTICRKDELPDIRLQKTSSVDTKLLSEGIRRSTLFISHGIRLDVDSQGIQIGRGA